MMEKVSMQNASLKEMGQRQNEGYDSEESVTYIVLGCYEQEFLGRTHLPGLGVD